MVLPKRFAQNFIVAVKTTIFEGFKMPTTTNTGFGVMHSQNLGVQCKFGWFCTADKPKTNSRNLLRASSDKCEYVCLYLSSYVPAGMVNYRCGMFCNSLVQIIQDDVDHKQTVMPVDRYTQGHLHNSPAGLRKSMCFFSPLPSICNASIVYYAWISTGEDRRKREWGGGKKTPFEERLVGYI